MKQEYREMQEKLLPGQEKQEEMWAGVVRRYAEEKQKKRRKYLKTGVAGSIVAAVLICMVFLPENGLADGMRKYIRSQFTKKSDITEDIQKDTYTDQGGHVKMRVREMLSDGTHVFMGICYTALDQEGKEWLAELNPKEITGWDDMIITGVASEDDIAYSSGWGENLVEQTEMATENERHFVFSYFNDGDASVSAEDHYTFRYTMPEGFREFQVTRKANLDKTVYRVKKNKASTDRFDLRYLQVSKLSFQLLMQQNSQYDAEEFSLPDNGQIAFVMKDGSKQIAQLSSQYAPRKDSELMKLVQGPEGDYSILSGSFVEEYGAGEKRFEAIDNPEEITAVEIGGNRYDYGDGLYHLVREK